MKTSLVLFVFALVAACGNPNSFELQSSGVATPIGGARSTLTSAGAMRQLEVCGDFPHATADDLNGSVCVRVSIDPVAAASLKLPATLTVSGTATATTDATGLQAISYVPHSGNAPAITSLWMQHNCFCINYAMSSFEGTVTLTSLDDTHAAGSFDLTVNQDNGDVKYHYSENDAVRAQFVAVAK